MLKRTVFLATILLAILGLALLPAAQAQDGAPTTSSLIVKLVAGLATEQQADVIARNGGTEVSTIPALRLHVIAVPTDQLADTLARYQADPQVVSAEENKTRQAEAAPADPLYSNQWALPMISWDLVFGTVMPTGSATVAILDTGIDASHPDLAGNVIPGTSILDGSNGLTDPSGHGTWMAGIIAARTDVPAEGIAGVGYAGVRVMPVTVLDANGLGQDSDVIAGVIWAVEHGANVILMAFSNPGFSDNLQEAIDYAWANGVVLVAAVGNDADSTPTFPAGDRGVIGVSATDATDQLAAFSNDGQAVFLAAPGTDIETTNIGGTYGALSGTSASAAIVAGAAALVKAVDPTLTNGVIVGRLARTADPAGTQEQTGNGRINLARALEDTGTDFIEPSGADPVGGGGPFVGPYVAAARNFTVTIVGPGSVTVTTTNAPTVGNGTVNAPVSCGGTGTDTHSQTITSTCTMSLSSNSATGTLTATPNPGSVFNPGWSGATNISAAVCTGTTLSCSYAVTGSNPAITATFDTLVDHFKVEAAGGGNIGTQTAGTAFGIKITAQDAGNNTIAGFTGQVTISSTGTLLAGSGTTANFVAGVLTSHSVTISNTGNFTITATGLGVNTGATGTSNSFTVNAGTLSALAFQVQPTNAVAGVAISPAVTVLATDTLGNPISSVSVTMVLQVGTGTLSGGGAQLTNGSGIATFNALSIDQTGTNKRLRASSGAVESSNSNQFSITAAAPETLEFTVQPTDTVAGATIGGAGGVAVRARDHFGNNVSSASIAMTLTTGTGTLSGTTPQTTTDGGVATFNDLSINLAGSKKLTASANGGAITVESNSFNITAAAANQLAFGMQPSNTNAGSSITPAVTVEIRDQFGNLTGSTASVTMAIGTNAGPGGTLTGTTPVAAVAGVATFSDLKIDIPGTGYTLTASSTGLTGATSNAFNILSVNTAPTVTAPANQNANEGASTSFALGSFSDPDGGSWTVNVNWGDGSAHTIFPIGSAGSLGSQTHSYADNGSYTVTVTVTDSTSQSGSATFLVTVANVAPTAIFGATSPIDEGTSSTLSLTGPSDPSTVDTAAGLHYSFACDGVLLATTYATAGTSASATCFFGQDGSYAVAGRIFDKDNGYRTYTATVTVSNVPPVVSNDLPSQSNIQYSDGITPVTISATDVLADTLTAASRFSADGGSTFSPGLPAGLQLDPGSCTTNLDLIHQTCTWTLSGHMNVPAGTYVVKVAVRDDDTFATTEITIVVIPEDAAIAFDASNPTAAQVASPGGASGPFFLSVNVTERVPDLGLGPLPGDISHAVVSIQLVPVGPGAPISGVCSPGTVSGSGYAAMLPVTCNFSSVPVNTYTVAATVSGGYYTAYAEDVLTVYDPSLGFTTGGGWFYWPGTANPDTGYPGDHTNFGYTMKYNKSMTNVQGSLLVIRHNPDGTIYRLKSNSLGGLSIGQGSGFGWASFSGKATYLQSPWTTPAGNYGFIVYVEDRNQPGIGVDRFWLQVKDANGVVVPYLSVPVAGGTAPVDALTLNGGNLVVPHR